MCCLICGMQRHKKFHSDLSKKRKDKNLNGKVNKSRNKVMGNNNINKYPHIHVPFEMPCLKEKKVLSFDSFIVLSAIDWTSVNDKKKIGLLLKLKSNFFCCRTLFLRQFYTIFDFYVDTTTNLLLYQPPNWMDFDTGYLQLECLIFLIIWILFLPDKIRD